MIRVSKPANAPRILRGRGETETDANRSAFDAAPGDYLAGRQTFKFKSKIYGAKSVKNALIKAQHKKCCFCESKITPIAYGDVEHFRPKGGFKQVFSDVLGRPGYYWLAYKWENLYLSCQICNQRFKGSLFPLGNPDERARSHHDDTSGEELLFIDPGHVDPENFISFREEYPYAIDGNETGRTTIDALGLDREGLNERRRDKLAMLKLLKVLADSTLPEADEARALLAGAVTDDAEYAAMARAALT